MSEDIRGVVVNAGESYENPTIEFFRKWLDLKEFVTLDSYRLALSEFFGTFYLCLMLLGCISSFESYGRGYGSDSSVVLFSVLCIWPIIVSVMWIMSHLSVLNMNPALSIAFAVNGVIPLTRACIYIPAQLLGAVCAPALLKLLVPTVTIPDEWSGIPQKNFAKGSNYWPTMKSMAVSQMQAIGWEFIGTALLAALYLAIFGMRHNRPHEGNSEQTRQGPILVGLGIMGILLFIMPFSGGSINPARSFGPAVVLGVWDYHYVYWVGPILGAVSGAAFYKWILYKPWKDYSCYPENNASTVRSFQVPLGNIQEAPQDH
jgi:MIP family channel proteins